MSDVQDWTGVSAGATELAGTGIVGATSFGPSWQFNWQVPNISQTTRSLLLIVKVLTVVGGSQNLTSVAISGNTSGLVWFGSTNIPDDGGNATINPTICAAPIYAPFYGQIDSQANIGIGAQFNGSLQWWLLALPDADILGSNPIPVAIANSSFSPFTPNRQVPIVVHNSLSDAGGNPIDHAELWSPASQTQVGTAANPLGVTSVGISGGSVGTNVNATTTPQQIVGAPAAGFRRIVELINTRNAASTLAIEFGGQLSHFYEVSQDSATYTNPPFMPGWILTSSGGGLTVATSAGTANVWATYHDEAIPS